MATKPKKKSKKKAVHPYAEFSDSELIQRLANATETYYGAIGHTKAESNKYACEMMTKELERRGVSVPGKDELLRIGVFNGPGHTC